APPLPSTRAAPTWRTVMKAIALQETSNQPVPVAAATKVAVVGATGYAGAELAAILARHANTRLCGLFSSTGGATVPMAQLHPALSGSALIAEPFALETLVANGAEVAFLATPNEVSAELAPKLLDAGVKVIDLSGAFRLHEEALYPTWY